MLRHVHGSQKNTFDTPESITPFLGQWNVPSGREKWASFSVSDSFYGKCHKSRLDEYFFMGVFLVSQGDLGASASDQKNSIYWHIGRCKPLNVLFFMQKSVIVSEKSPETQSVPWRAVFKPISNENLVNLLQKSPLVHHRPPRYKGWKRHIPKSVLWYFYYSLFHHRAIL